MCEKKEFLQTPFRSSECDVRWHDPACGGGGSLIGRRHHYIDGGERAGLAETSVHM
jgi:hypothetical protein